MTPDEYARKMAGELRDAHDHKNLAAIDSIFRNADQALGGSDLDEADKREFWATVRQYLGDDVLLLEKQANNALVALMRAIQQGLAAREKK
jgi:hypothetical protein